jgi:hypothetical protein
MHRQSSRQTFRVVQQLSVINGSQGLTQTRRTILADFHEAICEASSCTYETARKAWNDESSNLITLCVVSHKRQRWN